MAYSSISLLAQDYDFINRVASCAANEVSKTYQPLQWASEHIWWVAASPGFGEAYQYALDTDPPVERPGWDPSVITDGQILAAVQGLVAGP